VLPAEGEDEGMSRIREDGLALFKNLCKLSMKFATPDNPDEPLLLRGKVLSLELLRMVIDNAGPFWKTSDKYVHTYICFFSLYTATSHEFSAFPISFNIIIIPVSLDVPKMVGEGC
jgi:brefeldin A-inhibited guanine nucleotide-exchange protein